jgi:RNA polymerase sigma factor (sigma-70 family)
MQTNPINEVVPHLRRALAQQGAAERTDGQLLEDYVSRRDEAALVALVHRHGQMVWGVCRRILSNHHDAEDAFQATFLVLVRRAPCVVPREMVANWLHGVAHQSALHARRTVTRRRARERQVVEIPEPAVVEEELWNDLKPLLDEELRRLPDQYRVVVVLCDLEGKTRKEAARQLGCPEGTVAGRLARGRTMLAERLARRGLAVTGGTLTSVLSQRVTAAAVPTPLMSSTINATCAFAAGQATSLISPQVIALTEGARKAMLLSKHKIAILVLLVVGGVVGLAAAVSGLLTSRLDAATQQKPPTGKREARPLGPASSGDNTPQPADAELHVVAADPPTSKTYHVDGAKPGDTAVRVDVEVRPTDKPIVLVLTSYSSVDWHVNLAKEARITKVIVSGYFAQEIKGVPADVPLVNQSWFPSDGSRRKGGWFYPGAWNTPKWREMVRRLNELTGLPVATFQEDAVSFVVDGKQGRDLGQKEVKPKTPRKELTPKELFAISADSEMHVVGIYTPDLEKRGKPVDVEVRATTKPVVLVLTSYMETVWNIKLAEEARIKAVILGSGMPQEIDGLPADVPVHSCCPDGSSFYFDRKEDQPRNTFCAYHWNTFQSRRMVEKLNDLTGLLVSTFQGQGKSTGTSFVVDGARGSDFAQKERKPRPKLPKEPTPKEFLAACADAQLHVVSIYGTNSGSDQVDVEVRPTAKPIVLALASYQTALWNVKIAKGAQVKAVVIGGYYEQEVEGIPTDVPLIYRPYFPGQKLGYFYGHEWDKSDCQDMVGKLNDLTGLLVTTFQGAEADKSFVVDGVRGSQFAQKERAAKGQPKAMEDPLADVADVPAQELQAGGDVNKRYFLIGLKKDTKPAGKGLGLIVAMPGGDGSADFHPFVRRIYKHAVPEGYVLAQPVAVRWTEDQEIVWPTKKTPVPGMKFSTEEFVEAVIKDVADKHKIDPERVFTLTWSSSGPAAYAVSLSSDKITGSFVAMSVFKPDLLPPLEKAKGHAYFLYHSPDDRVCPFRMAEQAEKDLKKNGAVVKLTTYQGGHGWRGNLYDNIRDGIEWLKKNHSTRAKP